PIRVVGIDPQSVIVAMRHADRTEGAPAVVGAVHSRVQYVNAVSVARIGKHMGVIKRSLAILAVTAGERPGITAIIRAEESAFIRFHQGPYAVAAIGH